MIRAISNTSPLLYLYRNGAIDWLPKLFRELWVPKAVNLEMKEGRKRGYDVPKLQHYSWIKSVEPSYIPSEWLVLDLGAGELATMSLALENPTSIVKNKIAWQEV